MYMSDDLYYFNWQFLILVCNTDTYLENKY